MYFPLYLGIGCAGRGSPKGLVHNLLRQLFTMGSSKIEVSGIGDVMTAYAYWDMEGRCFAISSLAERRSQPVPKMRDDCFHQ